jgi:hypothetical protein
LTVYLTGRQLAKLIVTVEAQLSLNLTNYMADCRRYSVGGQLRHKNLPSRPQCHRKSDRAKFEGGNLGGIRMNAKKGNSNSPNFPLRGHEGGDPGERSLRVTCGTTTVETARHCRKTSNLGGPLLVVTV